MIDDRTDGGKQRLAILDELLGIVRALVVQVVNQFRPGDLLGGVLGHLLQDPFREIDFRFMRHKAYHRRTKPKDDSGREWPGQPWAVVERCIRLKFKT